jgi:hypothetical protein
MSSQAEKDKAWVFRAFKIVMIVGFSCAGLTAIVAFCVFLLIGGCAVKVVDEIDKASRSSSGSSASSKADR